MLSKRLKELRKQKDVTQRQVAITMNITERNYQRFEAGEKPNYDNLLTLADYFGVSLDYLVGRTDNPAVNE
jgi:transcriptional regulator with XRE-family HTH domain